MDIYRYDRTAAVAYARKWAFGRNKDYYDFSEIGGDCTNFASQCLYAGCGVMNYSPLYGWFYRSTNNRTPSWTGVEFLYKFLVANDSFGPFAAVTELNEIEIGDIVQLGDNGGRFYHSPVVVKILDGKDAARGTNLQDRILIAAHSYDALDKPLSSYNAAQFRPLHIKGYRN